MPRRNANARPPVTDDHRTNRMLYRLSRERVLTRTQLRNVRGTNALIDLLLANGWAYSLETEGDPVAITPAGEAAHEERRLAGNYATC